MQDLLIHGFMLAVAKPCTLAVRHELRAGAKPLLVVFRYDAGKRRELFRALSTPVELRARSQNDRALPDLLQPCQREVFVAAGPDVRFDNSTTRQRARIPPKSPIRGDRSAARH
jgi:hypothetical protein